jgi:GTP cyclohydrolase I
METVDSAAQDNGRPITEVSWRDIRRRIADRIPPNASVWGVPSGGSIVAALTGRMVDTIEQADIIVDDMVDSGATRQRFADTGKPFVALWDKQNGDADCGWLRFPWENAAGPEDAVVRLLEWVGEDPARDGLIDTPKRVVKAFREMTVGYADSPAEILSRTFDEPCDEMIVVSDIAYTSLCEHHMLPFTGSVDIGYVPGKVVGLSKLARLVDCFSRRLQIQERLTNQIADAITKYLEPEGVAVVVRGNHACMSCRGVRKAEATMVTSAMRGAMRDNPETRAEFLNLCR